MGEIRDTPGLQFPHGPTPLVSLSVWARRGRRDPERIEPTMRRQRALAAEAGLAHWGALWLRAGGPNRPLAATQCDGIVESFQCLDSPHEATPLNHLNRRSGPHCHPLPACQDPRSMQPVGLECSHVLGRQHLLRLLFLLFLLPQPVTRAQTKPVVPSAPTALGTNSDMTTSGVSSAPTPPGPPQSSTLQERAQALMRNFPLVDGWVDAGWRPVVAALTPREGRES